MDVNEQDFQEEVLRCTRPVLVEFWVPWSRPCQILDSVITEVAAALADEVKVVRINADDSLGLSLCFDIHSVPTLVYFAGGEPRLRIIGTASKEAILAKIKELPAANNSRR